MPELTVATSSPTREEPADPRPSVALQDTQSSPLHEEPVAEEDEDEFGDDFDDFEEGGDDADFDDFEEGFEQPTTEGPPTPLPPQAFAPAALPFVRLDRPFLFICKTLTFVCSRSPTSMTSIQMIYSMPWILVCTLFSHQKNLTFQSSHLFPKTTPSFLPIAAPPSGIN